jgi:hypothetical protein
VKEPCFDAFSSREPVPTSLEIAMAKVTFKNNSLAAALTASPDADLWWKIRPLAA